MRTYNIITIEREYASGGREVGLELAKRLGIPFYNEEILEMAAEEFHVDKAYIQHAEERVSSSILYNIAMNATIGINGINDLPLPEQLFYVEGSIIKRIAEKESCVIVGRCADYILSERKDVLHVFVYADQEARIKKAVNHYHINPNNAEYALRMNDRRRAQFYNTYSGKKWGDKENYHLCLNSTYLDTDTCVSMILQALTEKE